MRLCIYSKFPGGGGAAGPRATWRLGPNTVIDKGAKSLGTGVRDRGGGQGKWYTSDTEQVGSLSLFLFLSLLTMESTYIVTVRTQNRQDS